MSNLRKNIGLRIKELRKAKGLKQAELAEMVGLETTSLCKLENGSHFPKEDNLEKIAMQLDVTVQDLFNFHHHQDAKQLRDYLISTIQLVGEDKLRLIHKIVTSILY